MYDQKNKMKIIFKTFLLYFLLQNFVIAACDFKADFGEKKNIFETKNFVGRPFPMEHVGLEVFPILANDVCPNERLEDVGIEYRFLFDELIAINLVALNDDRNLPSEKLTLMNYVKKNYGDFDTTNNPLAYNGFEVFEKTNFFVVYQRESGEDGIMNEEIYISTPALDEKLGKFYADKEMEMIQNSQ